MIPISQQEDDEIEDQTFIPPKKNEENEKFPFKKTIIKSIFFIFIIIILIISYLPKKKSTGYNIQNVPDKIPDNKEAKEIEEDNKNNKEKIDDNKKEEKNNEKKNIDNNKEKEKENTENKDNTDKNKNEKTDIKEDKTGDTTENINIIFDVNLSIIINSFNNKNDLVSLYNNILSKNIENCEIIVTTNYVLENNIFNNENKELQNRKISTKYINYSENTNSLKMKIDSASKSRGKYIIFINPEEVLSLDILNDYKDNKNIKDNIDIIQYDLNYDRIDTNRIIYQPQLYESLFFDRDSFGFNHFHVNGKIYKSEIFIEATKNLDKLYLDNSDKYYDEIMILVLVFQKANTLIKLRNSNNCNRNRCQGYQYRRYSYKNNKEILKETVLFIKFLFECTGKDKVQEKRMAAGIFRELLISKDIKSFYNDELLNIMKDTINLYINSDLINDIDKDPIKNYAKNIRK